MEAVRIFPDAHLLVSHFAIVLREEGEPALAERFFLEAARLDPKRTDAWIALGNLAFDSGRDDEALARYARALELKPDSVEALSNTGKVHAMRKDFALAVTYLEKALEARPDSATALGTLGGVLIELGNLERAGELLQRALLSATARETLLAIHGNLGILHLRRREREKAIASFEEVLKLDPEDRRARETPERLRR